MKILEIRKNKKQYMELLILADEQEDMIDKYIDRGIMFVLEDNGVKSECVVTDEGNGVLEIKNIATNPNFQRMGYGKILILFSIKYIVVPSIIIYHSILENSLYFKGLCM